MSTEWARGAMEKKLRPLKRSADDQPLVRCEAFFSRPTSFSPWRPPSSRVRLEDINSASPSCLFSHSTACKSHCQDIKFLPPRGRMAVAKHSISKSFFHVNSLALINRAGNYAPLRIQIYSNCWLDGSLVKKLILRSKLTTVSTFSPTVGCVWASQSTSRVTCRWKSSPEHLHQVINTSDTSAMRRR